MVKKPSYGEPEQRIRELEQEVAERKRTELALRRSKELFEKTFVSQLDAIFILDGKIPPKVIDCNPAAERIFGYTRQEILGQTIEFLHINEAALREFQDKPYPKIDQRLHFLFDAFMMKRKDGTIFPSEHTVVPLHSENGEWSGWVSVVRDRAEMKLAEEELGESKDRFRALAESLPETIYEMDKKGNLTFVNRQACDHFHYTREDFHQGLNALDMLVPEDRGRASENITKILKGEKSGSSEYTALRKDGTTFPVTIYSSPILKAGKPVGLRGFIIDITERKRAEEQKRVLEGKLQRAQKMEAVGNLASGVGHNFRNILTVISMKTQIIQMKYGDHPALKDIVEGISTQVDRGARLVDRLMDFCRQEAKRGFQPINLAAVTQEVHELIKKAYDKGIEIRVETPEALYVMGDPEDLAKVLLNLCNNARDSMPEGGRLDIMLQEEGDRARVIVSDSGEGMDNETLGKCFDPFFTTKPTNRGTGLGLSVAYGIVKEHGGEIHVSSELGEGARFTFTIPLAPAPEKANA